MPDGQRPRQGVHQIGRGEVVAHIAQLTRRIKTVLKIVTDDPAGFLSAMLQRVQPKGHKTCRVRDGHNAKDTALLPELVVIPGQLRQGFLL